MNNSLVLGKKQKIKTLSLALLPVVLISFFIIFFSSSCRLYKLERKLDPVNAEFLSKVRYIITGKERKIFPGNNIFQQRKNQRGKILPGRSFPAKAGFYRFWPEFSPRLFELG